MTSWRNSLTLEGERRQYGNKGQNFGDVPCVSLGHYNANWCKKAHGRLLKVLVVERAAKSHDEEIMLMFKSISNYNYYSIGFLITKTIHCTPKP